jgi:hypothetical protein
MQHVFDEFSKKLSDYSCAQRTQIVPCVAMNDETCRYVSRECFRIRTLLMTQTRFHCEAMLLRLANKVKRENHPTNAARVVLDVGELQTSVAIAGGYDGGLPSESTNVALERTLVLDSKVEKCDAKRLADGIV